LAVEAQPDQRVAPLAEQVVELQVGPRVGLQVGLQVELQVEAQVEEMVVTQQVDHRKIQQVAILERVEMYDHLIRFHPCTTTLDW